MFSILNCVTLMIKVFVNHIFYFVNIQYSIKGGRGREMSYFSLFMNSWIGWGGSMVQDLQKITIR